VAAQAPRAGAQPPQPLAAQEQLGLQGLGPGQGLGRGLLLVRLVEVHGQLGLQGLRLVRLVKGLRLVRLVPVQQAPPQAGPPPPVPPKRQ
jgi:hypothetical protein